MERETGNRRLEPLAVVFAHSWLTLPLACSPITVTGLPLQSPDAAHSAPNLLGPCLFNPLVQTPLAMWERIKSGNTEDLKRGEGEGRPMFLSTHCPTLGYQRRQCSNTNAQGTGEQDALFSC